MSKLFDKTVSIVMVFTLLVLIVFSVSIYNSFKNNIFLSIRDDISKKISLSKHQIDPGSFEGKNSDELKIYADRIKALTELRTTIIDKQGVVIADSDVPVSQLVDVENHILREEVQEALKSGSGLALRNSATIDERLFYYCETIRKEGRIVGFLRLAMFYPELNSRLNFIKSMILKIDFLILSLVLLISLYYSYRYNSGLRKTRKQLMKNRDSKTYQTVPFQKHHELDRLIGAFNIFGKRLQNQVNLSNEKTTQLDAIFNSMTEGVAAFDSQGYIIWQNAAFIDILDIKEKDVHGKPFYDWLHFPPIVMDIEQFRIDSRQVNKRQKYYGKVYLEYQILPLKNGTADAAGFLLTITDVTRMQQLETIRQDFVANVSHEFKTPLASIRGFSETLLSGAVEKPSLQNKFLKKIEKQTFLLENLVSDLLELSRVEQNELEKTGKIDPLPVLDEIAEEFELLAKAKKMTCKIEKSGCERPLKIEASNELLRGLLTNLLYNAIQYNQPGGTIYLRMMCQADQLRIEVEDGGIGIAAADQERIFERFYRTDIARETNANGTGLGLSIARNIVDALNGEIGVESEISKGSLFWVKLPVLL